MRKGDKWEKGWNWLELLVKQIIKVSVFAVKAELHLRESNPKTDWLGVEGERDSFHVFFFKGILNVLSFILNLTLVANIARWIILLCYMWILLTSTSCESR